MKKLLCFLLVAWVFSVAGFSQKRAMTFEDMFTMKRVSSARISPDGATALLRVSQASVDENSYTARLYLVNLKTKKVKPVAPVGSGSPVWRPDGKAFFFTLGGQIYEKALDGSEPRQVTHHETGAGGPVLSADGKMLLFASSVKVIEEQDHSGKVLDDLYFRQWNRWIDGERSHVFVVDSSAGKAKGRDITPGDDNVPPISLGSGRDYTFSPDGKEAVIVKNTDEMVAASTNHDLFTVNLSSGDMTRLTTNKAWDAEPVYSPDGRYIAYAAMDRAGFEADRHELVIYDRKNKSHRHLDHQPDHDAGGFIWAPDSKSLYYTANTEGARSVFHIDLKGGVTRLTDTYTDRDLSLDAAGETLLFRRESTTMPSEIFAMNLRTKEIEQITFLNKPVLDQLAMNPWEDFWFDSSNGAKVQGFVIKPPFFEEGRKYPMIYLIHGGPQGMWGNLFHYRWNAQMFAAPGYVTVLVNPHGSKGYGQKFCDLVTRDWGGLPYEDLMKGLEVAIDRYPFIDKNRLAAAGASYGGYMINWIGVHDHPFKALVSHNGVYNMPSMYGTTEELWFPEWEFGGTYYENPDLYHKWSPHRLAGNYSAPMLVIHSELDYRVPINQGIELFTAHRRQDIPVRWLYFPDEDHFVRQPKNARMWWRTVHGWIGQYTETNKKASGS